MARRRRKKTSGSSHERWLVSYADFITLLFAFFTSMYAMSTVNEAKYKSFSEALSSAFNQSMNGSMISAIGPIIAGKGGQPMSIEFQKKFSVRYRRLQDTIKGLSGSEGIRLIMEKKRYIVRIPGGTLFSSGGASLLPGAKTVLSELALSLTDLHSQIKIEGHTDNVPMRNKAFQSNWDLSSARAITVLKFFVNQYDFDPTKISATGYGEYRPIGANDTPSGRKNNRRVDIIVMR